MSTLSTTVTSTVVLGGSKYPSPLTIESTGKVTPGDNTNGVDGTTAGLSLTNEGVIHGGYSYIAYLTAGLGVDLSASATVHNSGDGSIDGGRAFAMGAAGGGGVSMTGGGLLYNANEIAGGSGYMGGGWGGTGLVMTGGTLTNVSDLGHSNGNIIGGSGYEKTGPHHSAYSGGDGVDATNVTVINGDVNSTKYLDTSSGSIIGGHGDFGASGGIGLKLNGGSVANGFGSTIEGGYAGAGGGSGGIGIELNDGATLSNAYVIAGGSSSAANGAVAVTAGEGSTIDNIDSIKGGSGNMQGTGSGNGAAAVVLNGNAQLSNTGSGGLIKGGGGYGTGGAGVDLAGSSAQLNNDAKIYGGQVAGNFAGGSGVIVDIGASVTNYQQFSIFGGSYVGRIYGGESISGPGGSGVYLDGGTVTSSGGILGGLDDKTDTRGAAVQFGPVAGGDLVLNSGWSVFGNITGFAPGDHIDDTDFSYSTFSAHRGTYENTTIPGEIVITDPNGGTLTITTGDFAGELLKVTADAGNSGIEIFLACYLRGTRIRTEDGDVVIESLRIGDRVVTRNGDLRPVRWVGWRSYRAATVTGNREVLPVRIGAGALGAGLPLRDLYVSPEHALLIHGALVPARALLNGTSIRQDERFSEVTYFHLEFDAHEVIYAEGAAAESFVDDANREMFDNVAQFHELYPDAPRAPAIFCAPRIEYGAELEAIRNSLATHSVPETPQAARDIRIENQRQCQQDESPYQSVAQ